MLYVYYVLCMMMYVGLEIRKLWPAILYSMPKIYAYMYIQNYVYMYIMYHRSI